LALKRVAVVATEAPASAVRVALVASLDAVAAAAVLAPLAAALAVPVVAAKSESIGGRGKSCEQQSSQTVL
jgi:hypothetical protein